MLNTLGMLTNNDWALAWSRIAA